MAYGHARRRGPFVSGLSPTFALAVTLATTLGACVGDLPTAAHTVDLGDHFEAPDRHLDEDTFHCVIQPRVIEAQRCAGGLASDRGGCHLERSALRLVEVIEPARCDDDVLLGPPPLSSQANLTRIRASVGIDAEASPFYRRPIGLDSHPRVIFPEDSAEAELVRDWINAGSTP